MSSFVLLHLNGRPIYFQVNDIAYVYKKENSKQADIYVKSVGLYKVDESFEEVADLLDLEPDYSNETPEERELRESAKTLLYIED